MNANSIALTPVKSSQLAAIGHDPATETLAIQFLTKGQPGNVYHYRNFTAAEYAAFASAESAGAHFGKHIKPHGDKHPFQNMGVPSAAPVATATVLIGPMLVERDADGWWSHPGIPDFNEDIEAHKAWMAAQGLVTAHASLDSEGCTHPAYIAYYDEDSASVAGWSPETPAGEGWFTLSIHDTEDGPYWVWARSAAVQLAEHHAAALDINARCYGEPLPGGQRYSRTTFKDNGYPILLTADGKRSVFCDVDE